MKKLIVGNWKMNGSLAQAHDLAGTLKAAIEADAALEAACDFVICPPSIYIAPVKSALEGSAISLGAQNCAKAEDGAYTGEISAAMVRDVGCGYVILGHSERRQYHDETDADVAAKARLAHAQGLVAIICVGETDTQRAAGEQEQVVGNQLRIALPDCATPANTVIAYEPVWAIGTGKNATPEDIAAMHRFIRGRTQAMLPGARILYGGSVKPDNAGALFRVENVDGALIGGASLKAEQFLGIARAVV